MHMLKKIALIFLILIVVSLLGGLIFRYHLMHRALPDYDESLSLSHLTDEVTVHRDAYGMPHVYAQNEADLYRAVGYLSAQDRFWQMDLLRRVTLGRVSEIVGEKAIPLDLLMRSLELTKKSNQLINNTDPKIVAALTAYADGVNQYLEDYKDKLPQEFTILGYTPEKWEIMHSVNLIGYMAWDLTPNYNAEFILEKMKKKVGQQNLKHFVPNESDTTAYIFPDFELNNATTTALGILDDYDDLMQELGISIFSASNNWAVSGKKTASGQPILCNDMHLKLALPGIWYPMHQVVEGGVNVTGVVLPGQPLVVSGHNENIAWGMTNVTVDNIDFYQEKINPQDTSQYLYNGEYRSIRQVEETIKLKGGEEKKRTIRYTHHGPIITDFRELDGSQPLAMKWVGSDIESDEFRTIYLLNNANNWSDFKEAIRSFGAVSQNINYADVEGNIGLYCAAGIPIRKSQTPYTVSPGWTDSTEWQGYVPFEALPFEYNPESGYVASANNKTVANYPYYIGNWFAPEYRISRIRELLEVENKITPNYMEGIITDFHSNLAEEIVPTIITVLQSHKTELSTTEKESIQLLSSWNYDMSTESAAALIYNQTIVSFLEVVLKDELGDSLFTEMAGNNMLATSIFDIAWFHTDWPFHDNISTEKHENLEDNILLAFKSSIVQLTKDIGTDPNAWQWGKNHQLTLEHPLGKVAIVDLLFNYNKGPYEMGGSKNTVAPFHYQFDNPKKVTHGPSQRHIYTVGNWDQSQTVIPGGISGQTASPHYADQLELYLKGTSHGDFFSKKVVEKNTTYTMTFTPK